MNIQFREITDSAEDKKLWESINHSAANSSFLSSNDWLDFQRSIGKEIRQFFIEAEDGPIGIIPVELHNRRIAKFAYAAYAPVIVNDQLSMNNELSSVKDSDEELWNEIFRWMKQFAKEHSLNLFRMDPLLPQAGREILHRVGFTRSLAPAQAIDTWVAPLTDDSNEPLSDKALLKIQDKNTRYYIKRAAKKGVSIRKIQSEKDILIFTKLMSDVMERKGFVTHGSDYYETQWKQLNPKSMTDIWLAEFEGKAIAGALFNYYKDTANYAFGASTSDPKLQKLASPYLLHYGIMKDARDRGFSKYNFWGVVPKEIGEHNMRGLSDFKMKFAGKLVGYVGPHDAPGNLVGFALQRMMEWWSYTAERY